MAKVNGIALGMLGTGFVFLYAGIKGVSIPSALQNLVRGKSPLSANAANQWTITAPTATPGTTPGATPTGAVPSAGGNAKYASDAQRFNGHKYVFGGASNPTNGWDCSSFASYILGHDFGKQIPNLGGSGTSSWAAATNNGSTHGPVASDYLNWPGAVNITAAQAQPGDLLVWQTHIGFVATDGKSMISAYDTASGTLITPNFNQAGPGGEVLTVRRIK
jgi:cell wall-associated NlpC family hydrolase